ncbi:amidohydrolase [Stieleria sp. ICT_E10.1]|uniref:amidohydrolase n=1 Tax=Stieleria sedimenti TaxID=2976331 RepID=UPI0021802218|nr:amidohydrolase [Stieleria sedimenti]MCS7471180.1 amidohydrolase [Stieleria sedimenti]
MNASPTESRDRVEAIDHQVAHLWMVRTFLKHADEAEDDEELRSVVRDIYDFILAVGPIDDVQEDAVYLKMAKKKLSKLRKATELYEEIQPEVSGHTNFVMAAKSLRLALDAITKIVNPPVA